MDVSLVHSWSGWSPISSMASSHFFVKLSTLKSLVLISKCVTRSAHALTPSFSYLSRSCTMDFWTPSLSNNDSINIEASLRDCAVASLIRFMSMSVRSWLLTSGFIATHGHFIFSSANNCPALMASFRPFRSAVASNLCLNASQSPSQAVVIILFLLATLAEPSSASMFR